MIVVSIAPHWSFAGNIDAQIQIPEAELEKGKDFEKELREALHTSRLEEQLKGPTKAGIMWLRVKTEAQWLLLLTDLRTTSRGDELLVLQRGQNLPPWPTSKLVLSYAAESNVAVKVQGDCYNLKAFLPAVGFEWRKYQWPFERPTDEEKLQKLARLTTG